MRVANVIEYMPVNQTDATNAANEVLASTAQPLLGEPYFANDHEVIFWNIDSTDVEFSVDGRRFTGKRVD